MSEPRADVLGGTLDLMYIPCFERHHSISVSWTSPSNCPVNEQFCDTYAQLNERQCQ